MSLHKLGFFNFITPHLLVFPPPTADEPDL